MDAYERADLTKSGCPLLLTHLQGAPFTVQPLGRVLDQGHSFGVQCMM